ncbi:MAG: GNAT family N-acetyltransferase [Clostridia bacterium]|nr:GNAT family N-acetyltransferase [Clostridia bacterium]
MNSRNTFQKEVIRKLKFSKSLSPLEKNIIIFNENNNYIGRLKPLDAGLSKNNEVIYKLTEWRSRFMRHFLTQFTTTEEGTRNWLERVLLPNDDIILFLVYNEGDNLIGQIGFNQINENSAAINNLIQGEIHEESQLYYYAEKALLKWGLNTLKLKNVYGFVLVDNFMNDELSMSVGLKMSDNVPLNKSLLVNELRLLFGESGRNSSDSVYLQKVELNLDEMFSGVG